MAMKLAILAMVVTLYTTTTAATTTTHNPYETGPHPTQHVHITALLNPGLEEELDVWVPSDPGKYLVMYFIDGLGGLMPGVAYNELFQHLASHGVVTILPWSLGLPLNPIDKVPVFESVLAWAEQHLMDKLQDNGVAHGVLLYLHNFVLGAHSAGAHVQVEYLKEDRCDKVLGQVMYSPVDGFDPLGLTPIFCITPGEYLNYAMPTLHISAGYDNVPGFSGISCAPEDLSNQRFYQAMDPEDTSKWTINATQFAHNDLLDDVFINTLEQSHFCGYNANLTIEQHALYRRFVGGQTAVFIKGLFSPYEQECRNYMEYLENQELMPIEVENDYVNPKEICPRGYCEWWWQPSNPHPNLN